MYLVNSFNLLAVFDTYIHFRLLIEVGLINKNTTPSKVNKPQKYINHDLKQTLFKVIT